ncbi:MAG: nuclear transport factor 2 family protein [Actinomycetota bacterium]|nr:nuclear transport factor 2 family protein [Actinomycetota bacterium]
MPDDDVRAANRALFETVLETISAGKFEMLADFMTDDLVFDLPYGPDFLPNPIEGLEQWNQMQLMTFKMFSSFALTLDEIHECLDPDELVAEYHSDAVVVRNGNAYENRYIGVLRFRSGKISHWREYHNPQATDVL